MGSITGLDQALAALARPGGVVLYPTQTLYGIGGRASDPAAARRVAQLKGRPVGGLIVLMEDPPLRDRVAIALARALWPGPLTIVVPAWPGLPVEVLGPDGTVAVRPPLHPAAIALVRGVGPITSTSANLSGAAPLLDPRGLDLAVDAVVDVGPLPPSPPSSIVRGDTGALLREGAIPAQVIARVLSGLRL
jgi:L-threonylcarbamoyladenylate synthase